MKIERISESQVKFILNQADLSQRNIKISELAYGSVKMQSLFSDMLEQATRECGFVPEQNVPLMIEAIPLSAASIMIIVTKVTSPSEFEQKISLVPQIKGIRKKAVRPAEELERIQTHPDAVSIYSFLSLDDVTKACLRLKGLPIGTNCLYRRNGRYLLLVGADTPESSSPILESVLCEYGYKTGGTPTMRWNIAEHGEAIIKADAIRILASL